MMLSILLTTTIYRTLMIRYTVVSANGETYTNHSSITIIYCPASPPNQMRISADDEVLNMDIYPNPATEFVSVSELSSYASYQVNINSMAGTSISDIMSYGTLDISGLTSGFYILQYTLNGQEKSSVFIKND